MELVKKTRVVTVQLSFSMEELMAIEYLVSAGIRSVSGARSGASIKREITEPGDKFVELVGGFLEDEEDEG